MRNRLSILVIGLGIISGMQSAFAFTWDDLWWRADQQGEKAMNAGNPKKAAELFHSSDWQGVAHYRAGNYKQALENFSSKISAQELYNKGNTLAQMGEYQQAIAAYQQALQQDPQLADAKYNKDLLEKLLQQNPKKQDSQQNNQQKQDQQQSQQQAQNQMNQTQQDKSQQDKSQQDSAQQQSADKAKQTQQEQNSASQNQQDQQRQDASPQPAAPSAPKDANPAQQMPAGQAQPAQQSDKGEKARAVDEQQQATEQWLSGIPDDPGGLLQQKFRRDHENYQDLQSQGQSPW